MKVLVLLMILGLQAPAVHAYTGKLDLQLAQSRRRQLPPRDYDDQDRRRRYYDQDEYEYDDGRDPNDVRISKDKLVGMAALVVPGGGFLLWMDPTLDHKYVNTGSGLFLALITAAIGIKFYVSGDFGPALAVHGGGIAGGLWGHHIAVRRPTVPRRRGSLGRSDPINLEAKFRF